VEQAGRFEQAGYGTGVVVGAGLLPTHVVVGAQHDALGCGRAKRGDDVAVLAAIGFERLLRHYAVEGFESGFDVVGGLVERAQVAVVAGRLQAGQKLNVVVEAGLVGRHER
jgi:hypothetical protein